MDQDRLPHGTPATTERGRDDGETESREKGKIRGKECSRRWKDCRLLAKKKKVDKVISARRIFEFLLGLAGAVIRTELLFLKHNQRRRPLRNKIDKKSLIRLHVVKCFKGLQRLLTRKRP